MIDKILSIGDSFTYGTDLKDCDGVGVENYSRLTWPALVAQQLNLNYISASSGGIGNREIAHRVFGCADISTMVIINWSWIDRFDYQNGNTILPGHNGTNEKFWFANLQNDFDDKVRSLMYVNAVHGYLKSNNIPFISTIMDHLMFDESYHSNQGISKMISNVKKDITYFPDNLSFLEWSRANNYPESASWHPLEQAHSEASKIMLPVVEKAINTYIK